MEKFIIKGQLQSDKTLTINQDTVLSQGENVTTTLVVTLPEQFADNILQFEFGCPNDYNYVTPNLNAQLGDDGSYTVKFDIESCILQYVGVINVQLTVRDKADNSIVWKSKISHESTLYVNYSIDGKYQTYAKQDFFAQAYEAIEKITTASDKIEESSNQVNAVKKQCDDFLTEYQQKLDSGELRGEQGANITAITQTGKDTDGNSIYTITMSDGVQFNFTVPVGEKGEQGEKGDKGEKGDPGDVNSTGSYPLLTAGKAIADGNGNNIVDTYATKDTISHPNLLINSNFKINQRGNKSYSPTSPVYTVDRWKTAGQIFGGVTFTPVDDGISIKGTISSGDRSLVQVLEKPLDKNKTYTLSASVDGVIKSLVLNNFTATQRLIFGSIRIDVYSAGNIIGFVTNNVTTIDVTVNWVKLEEGIIATQYTEPEPTLELLRCQRYYYKVSSTLAVFNGYVFGDGTSSQLGITLPTVMDKTPTLTITDISQTELYSNSAKKVTSYMLLSYQGNHAVIKLIPETPCTPWTTVACRFFAPIEFDAEL